MFAITLMAMSWMDEEEDFLVNLYRDYFALMRRQAEKIVKDRSLAEDMVHEAFINLFGHVRKLMGMNRGAVVSYLLVTVRRVSVDYVTKKGNSEIKDALSSSGESCPDLRDSGLSVDEQLVRSELVEDMAEAIRQLPQKYQDVLNFKYLLEMSDGEIAQLLHISKNSVREYLTRARRKALKIYESGRGRK